MNATYAVRELVESARSGWIPRGLAGPTSDVLAAMAADHGWLFRQVALDGVSTHNELMQALAQQLRLPDYFGQNWDALDECLMDLGAGKTGVLIRLKGLKTLPDELAQTLVGILDDRVKSNASPFIVVADPPLPTLT